MLLWILFAVIGLIIFVGFSRAQRQESPERVIRRHFQSIARMRLVAACPDLEGLLGEGELRLLFDWILIELYRRTDAPGFGKLMRWSLQHGEGETTRLTAEVTREAVDRLPRPVLEVIDGCGGRTVAGVIIDEALTEAGQRAVPKSNGRSV